jgi:hypothetical protein
LGDGKHPRVDFCADGRRKAASFLGGVGKITGAFAGLGAAVSGVLGGLGALAKGVAEIALRNPWLLMFAPANNTPTTSKSSPVLAVLVRTLTPPN